MRMPARAQFGGGMDDLFASAASATETLMVEQGWNPAPRASFWLTMESIRPVVGVHRHHRAVVSAQGIHRRPADGQILAIHVVARGRIGESRLRPGSARRSPAAGANAVYGRWTASP